MIPTYSLLLSMYGTEKKLIDVTREASGHMSMYCEI